MCRLRIRPLPKQPPCSPCPTEVARAGCRTGVLDLTCCEGADPPHAVFPTVRRRQGCCAGSASHLTHPGPRCAPTSSGLTAAGALRAPLRAPRGESVRVRLCGSDTSSIPSVEPAATRGCALWSLVSSRRTGVRVKKGTRPPACLPERRSRGLVPAPESTPGRPPPRVAPRVGLFGPPDGPHASPRASSSFMPLSAPRPKPGPRQRGVRGRRCCRPGRPPKRPRGVAARLPDRGP